MELIRIPPLHYVHVADQNTNITHVRFGPQSYMLLDSETMVNKPSEMITIPPRSYCVVSNPVMVEGGEAKRAKNGQFLLKHGEAEVRTRTTHPEPFPLFPGEELDVSPRLATRVAVDHGLQIHALRDFDKHMAGDEWLFTGPGIYWPRVEEEVVAPVAPVVLESNQALRLRASNAFQDRSGVKREAGEEWLVRTVGAYLVDVHEKVVQVVLGTILDSTNALHLRAARTFKDIYGIDRKAGQEWLVTAAQSNVHVQDVHEEVVGEVQMTTLSDRQYCVIVNPVTAEGQPQWGAKVLRRGHASFFLQPGEEMPEGVQANVVLNHDEALLVSASEEFTDDCEEPVVRKPGERWMIYGPCEYVPHVSLQVLELRSAIALHETEGIYVRDVIKGSLRAVVGKTYMLTPNEELWKKELPAEVEALLARQAMGNAYVPTAASAPDQFQPGMQQYAQSMPVSSSEGRQPYRMCRNKVSRRPYESPAATADGTRDATRVVTFNVPHNCAIQVYDYASKTSRVAFGPATVMLMPDEHFTVLQLSGGRPKKPNQIQTLVLALGPDFMTDEVEVVTSDHARLRMTLAYNWKFDVTKGCEERIFNVKDFIGDMCKTVGAVIRGEVAATTFDAFHKNSAKLVRVAVLGRDDNGKVLDERRFVSNGMMITNVDIKSIEPVDSKTKDMLRKSVQLAFEITTKSLEASARREAEKKEQSARARLDQQRIDDEAEAESTRKELLDLKAKNAAVSNAGQAKAEASAAAVAAQINAESALECTKTKSQAKRVLQESELLWLRKTQEHTVKSQVETADIEIDQAQALASIEGEKLQRLMSALGQDTMVDMYKATTDAQVELLQGLDLQGFVVMDSQRPLSLYQTATGLLSGLGHQPVRDDTDAMTDEGLSVYDEE